MSERCILGVVKNFRGNPTNLISTNVSVLRLFPSQFSKLVNQTDCRKSFFGVFSRYLEVPMSERHILGVIGNVRRNPMNLISTNVSGLKLFSSQYSKLADQTDCRKSFFGVFPQYLELPMSERCVLGVIGNIRGNPMNLISTNVSKLRLFLSQFSKLVDRIDCRKSFKGAFCDI